ncbi:MAG: glycogen debranching protein [Desulfobacteraceae bacterium]|nr:MAG: glycogen debranching protein [Desulfobacteraceae bacterium]
MNVSAKDIPSVRQEPEPGKHFVMFRGDTFSFTLRLSRKKKGMAWLRTNIGRIRTTRKEIIQEVDHEMPYLGRDWFDIPMIRLDDDHFRITLPLCQVGHFEGKCFFLPEGSDIPVWPPGDNTAINVSPAHTCSSNVIYNTFVRQFGPNKEKRVPVPEHVAACVAFLDQSEWSVIPPSGRFRDLIKELDFIIGNLGCRFIQLLPIHPTPTTYARMGRFGSPYAAQSFTDVDPALAEFDPKETPVEQFIAFVDAVHARNAEVILDIAINHTGWAAALHNSHPEWLVRDRDGRIEMPGAWGVTWADLTRLDYSKKGLWTYMAGIFLIWCERGVDGFRCDAGYMVPVVAWKYIISLVREQYPDTIFFLEGLGGKISVTRELLNNAGFDWAYSELFQNYDRHQIESYLPDALQMSRENGITIHLSETHDNERLAKKSKSYSRMRNALCALFSVNGGYGFAGGVEWCATEKIIVHDATSLNWGAADNLVADIRRLTRLLEVHPAFHDQVHLEMVHQDGERQVALLRYHPASGKKLLVLVNLDEYQAGEVFWDKHLFPTHSGTPVDLLTGAPVSCYESHGRTACRLSALQVMCLSADHEDLSITDVQPQANHELPDRIRKQMLRAKALDIFEFYHRIQDLGAFDPDRESEKLAENPYEYCRSRNPFSRESRVVVWQYPGDAKREVMVPPGHFLMIRAGRPFRASILEERKTIALEKSLAAAGGTFFAIFKPVPVPGAFFPCTLKIAVYRDGRCEHAEAPLLFLPEGENNPVQTAFNRHEILSKPLLFLGTNGRGGMMRSNVFWEKLDSKYDSLLAANLHPGIPVDRWMMLARCRMWIVFQGYSQEIVGNCLDSFQYDYHSAGIWRYHVPAGQGEHIRLDIRLEMIRDENEICFTFLRNPANGLPDNLADDRMVRLIIRPDIEDRSFHDVTKAYLGPEHRWPSSVTAQENGFLFSPDPGRVLQVQAFPGKFSLEPEWRYMVHRARDRERGHDPDSDLYSPGYFTIELVGGQSAALTARHQPLLREKPVARSPVSGKIRKDEHRSLDLLTAMTLSLEHYIVKRESHQSVIAGYPWFLDWGRDALIFARGVIAAGKTTEALSILELFGQFESHGTLPNMIHGTDAGNRDTSDAPFWFFVACSDLAEREGGKRFYSHSCGQRTFREILVSIGNAVISGTPNQIVMDPESGLIFSPSHYTWMDTNHPAGTPRQGYPIEIQALWYHALSVLEQIDSGANGRKWGDLKLLVRKSITELFYHEDRGYLLDCLHGSKGTPARQAEPDDSLRPNQLFAVTLGAVDDMEIRRRIVEACQVLIVPGAIRSLADQRVARPLEIIHHGKRLKDPFAPYQGKYTGDEDTERKPAYHNGTAWTWVFPSFCEAWAMAFGSEGVSAALSWLGSSVRVINEGCAGHVPEILDGDYPHLQRGCDAQAWGASELLRVRRLLLQQQKQENRKGGWDERQKTVSQK